MNFTGIIQSAENSENDLYFKKKKEKYFKIYRRNKSRLQLCCRREPESCNYSIRCNLVTPNGIVQIQEENQIHSCHLRFLSKSSKIADSDVKSIQRIVNDCAVQRENSLLRKESSSTDDEYSFSSSQPYISSQVSSREECGTSKQLQKENSLLPKEPSSTDDEYVFSSSQPYISSQDSSSSVAVAAAAATICNVKKGGQRSVLSMPVESSREECGPSKQPPKENSLVPKEPSSTVDDDVFSTRISKLMSVFDSLQLSTEQKMHMSLSLRYLLNHQFGLPLVNLLFCEYEKIQRDQMILDLQMLRSLNFPEKNPTTYISPRNIPADYPSNCRKRKFETEFVEEDSDYEKKYDSDDGDIVTYVDKPNTFL